MLATLALAPGYLLSAPAALTTFCPHLRRSPLSVRACGAHHFLSAPAALTTFCPRLRRSLLIEKLPPPKTVTLNFASYAEKPRFKPTVPITFVADGKVVLKIEGYFKGNDAEFCYLKIPYSAFDRMVSGKELTIKLGDKEYPLTPSQLAAMKQMTDYVTN